MALPTDAQGRKNIPIFTGLLKYFPLAQLGKALLSKRGNDQHNPGEPLHWAREKSSDHPDCSIRHMMDTGLIDNDGFPHSLKAAWRADANAELDMEHLRSIGIDIFAMSKDEVIAKAREFGILTEAAESVQDKPDDDGWIVADPDSRPKVKYDSRWSDGDIFMREDPVDHASVWRACCIGPLARKITHWRPSKEF